MRLSGLFLKIKYYAFTYLPIINKRCSSALGPLADNYCTIPIVHIALKILEVARITSSLFFYVDLTVTLWRISWGKRCAEDFCQFWKRDTVNEKSYLCMFVYVCVWSRSVGEMKHAHENERQSVGLSTEQGTRVVKNPDKYIYILNIGIGIGS